MAEYKQIFFYVMVFSIHMDRYTKMSRQLGYLNYGKSILWYSCQPFIWEVLYGVVVDVQYVQSIIRFVKVRIVYCHMLEIFKIWSYSIFGTINYKRFWGHSGLFCSLPVIYWLICPLGIKVYQISKSLNRVTRRHFDICLIWP